MIIKKKAKPTESIDILEDRIKTEFLDKKQPDPKVVRKQPTRWTHTGFDKQGKYGIVWREVEMDLLGMYRSLKDEGRNFPIKDNAGVRTKIKACLMHLVYDCLMERKELAILWGVSTRTINQVLDRYGIEIASALDRIDWKARCAGYKSFKDADRHFRGTTKDLAKQLEVKPKAIEWVRKQLYE